MFKLTDTLPFGKYKSRTVEFVLNNDPGWVQWLRTEKLKNKENAFTEEVDVALKSALKKAKQSDYLLPRADGEKAAQKLKRDLELKANSDASEGQRKELYADTWGVW